MTSNALCVQLTDDTEYLLLVETVLKLIPRAKHNMCLIYFMETNTWQKLTPKCDVYIMP